VHALTYRRVAITPPVFLSAADRVEFDAGGCRPLFFDILAENNKAPSVR
jgi:hypothetical protein